MRSNEWRLRIGAAAPGPGVLASPTKLAYRWARGLAGWQPGPVGNIEGNDAVPCDPCDGETEGEAEWQRTDKPESIKVPLADQAAVERQAKEWSDLLKVDEPYQLPSYPESPQQVCTLLQQALRTAASSFPLGTGLGTDNISPRAILRLSSEAPAGLAMLLAAFEALGHWARSHD